MKGVYLGGPIMGRPDSECVAWRRTAAQLLTPLRAIDPLRGRDYRGAYEEPEVVRYIVEEDLGELRQSFCVLVFYDQPSVGTSMEIRHAYAELRIPVYVVDISKRPRSPWLAYHTSRFFDSIAEAVDHIKLTAPANAVPKDWWLRRYLIARMREAGHLPSRGMFDLDDHLLDIKPYWDPIWFGDV